MPPFDFLKKNATTRSYPTDILIGELFVKAGVISQKQLDDTARSAGTKHLHIGQMLTMSGFINHRDLQSAVDAQSMLRDKVIDMNLAARCLKISCKSGANFQELVKEELAIEQQASTQTNRLGELLMDSGIINKAVFGAAMQRSLATGLPLGRILVLNGSMADSLLRVALELQVRVRDDMMARHEALDALRTEAAKAGTVSAGGQGAYADIAHRRGPQKTVRIGELLVMAHFLNETDVMSCLELGLLSERPIGEVMVEQGYVSDQMLQVALVVQQMIEDGKFDRESAGAALKKMQETGQILPEVQAELAIRKSGASGDDVAGSNGELESEFSQAAAIANAPATSEDGPSLESLMASVVGTNEPKPSGSLANPGNTLSRLAALEAHYLKDESLTAQAEDESGNGARRDTASSKGASSASDSSKEYGGEGATGKAHTFEDLLIAGKVLTSEDIDRALLMARQNPLALADVLKTTGFLTDVGRQAALDCNQLMEKGDLGLANAAQVLDHCINQGRLRNLTFEQALVELGWTREDSGAAAAVPADVPEALPFSLESKLFAVEESLAAAAEAVVEAAPLAPVVETPAPALSALLDSLDSTPDLPITPVEEKSSDLLSLFGLAEDGSEIDEVDEKTALAASQAEALMASLAQIPDQAIVNAEAEAAADRPESFETTAVFRSMAEAEVEKIADKALSQESSLDSLLSKLEGAVNSNDNSAASPAAGNGLPAVDSKFDTAGDASFISDFLSSDGLLSSDFSLSPTDLSKPETPIEEALVAETRKVEPKVEDAAPEDEVDLRSLFSSLKSEPAKPGDSTKPLASPAAPVAPSVASPSPSPVSSSVPSPVLPAAAPAASVPAQAPTSSPITSPTPLVIPQLVASTPVAPPTQVEAAPTVSVTPTQAQAAVPAPTPSPAPSASAPPSEPKPTASNSRLTKMNEAEVAAAKAAQIATMSSALTKMAEMHYEQENYPEAQRAYERILSWRQGELGASHPEVVDDLNNLAGVMCVQGLFGEAEPLIARAIVILEHAEEPEPLKLAENLTSLAGLQFQQGVFDKAEPLLAKALVLREKELGANNPELADSLRDFAKLLKKLGKPEEAEKHYNRAKVLLGRA
ncbi:hypothetical protein BH11CYA1_BH11CYA1_15140 [soil metagenome]